MGHVTAQGVGDSPRGNAARPPSALRQGDLEVDYELIFRPDARATVIFVESIAPDALTSSRAWSRSSMLLDEPVNRLYINDPTLRAHPGTTQGWGLGSTATFGIDAMSRAVSVLSDHLSGPRVYVGSGAGGYVALYLAVLHEAYGAVVSNPDLGWHTSPGPSAQALLSTLPPAEVERRQLDIAKIGRAPRGTFLHASVNTANPIYSDRIMTPLLGLLERTDSPIDDRTSQTFIYHDDQRASAPLAPLALQNYVMASVDRAALESEAEDA